MPLKTYSKQKKIVNFFTETFDMFVFLLRLIITEDLKNYIKKAGSNAMCASKKLIVLGNGPSLKDVLKTWKDNENFKNADFMAVNYFCHDETFKEIKPKYYVLTDFSFFLQDSLVKVNKMYETLNESVDWTMFLYIQYYGWKSIDWSKRITNKNIRIIPFHGIQYAGYSSLRNFFYKNGLARGNVGTVILTGELIALNIGYKELYLYGVDHNFFDNLCIDENNRLCNIKTYFYDSKPDIKPVVYFNKLGREVMHTVSTFLEEKMILFKGHEYMRSYVDYCSARIYNCTKNSLIDAYERL
jgi:hypothetical protein